MESVIKLLTSLIEGGNIGTTTIGVIFTLILIVGTIIFTAKTIIYIKDNFGNSNHKPPNSSKADINELSRFIEKEFGRIEASIRDIEEQLELLRQTRNDDRQAIIPLQKDIELFTMDSKSQYLEITRQVQGIQRDLASLHGTILGLETTRSQLK
jgi:hypothetical protein